MTEKRPALEARLIAATRTAKRKQELVTRLRNTLNRATHEAQVAREEVFELRARKLREGEPPTP